VLDLLELIDNGSGGAKILLGDNRGTGGNGAANADFSSEFEDDTDDHIGDDD
jgi:hypothetical protein